MPRRVKGDVAAPAIRADPAGRGAVRGWTGDGLVEPRWPFGKTGDETSRALGNERGRPETKGADLLRWDRCRLDISARHQQTTANQTKGGIVISAVIKRDCGRARRFLHIRRMIRTSQGRRAAQKYRTAALGFS